ncbi:MAG TPA: ferritin family protein [Candidatus Angelobacter sp.]
MTDFQPDVLRTTLLRAIQIERRNSELYESLASIFDDYDDSVKAMFIEMAEEERQHGTDLKQRYRARFGPVPLLIADPKEVIEAPDLPDGEALVFDSMTPEKALQAGLQAEEDARHFYSVEVTRTSDPELQQLYRELGEFEETHVRMLQDKLAQATHKTNEASR